MDDKSKKSHTDDHNQLPSDESTRNKINKHLSDINDTISEEDIKNVNTDTGAKTGVPGKSESKKEVLGPDTEDDDDTEMEREAPTPWEILD